MRIVFLVPLLLTACTGGPLYPDRIDTRNCPQVVSDSYKSLGVYKKKSTFSTLTTLGITVGVCVVTQGVYCAFSGIGAFAVDKTLDPYGKQQASNKFNENMRKGRYMKCTETWK